VTSVLLFIFEKWCPYPADPLVTGMDPRIRIHTKTSCIRNTGLRIPCLHIANLSRFFQAEFGNRESDDEDTDNDDNEASDEDDDDLIEEVSEENIEELRVQLEESVKLVEQKLQSEGIQPRNQRLDADEGNSDKAS
jgi:hypothetical protein